MKNCNRTVRFDIPVYTIACMLRVRIFMTKHVMMQPRREEGTRPFFIYTIANNQLSLFHYHTWVYVCHLCLLLHAEKLVLGNNYVPRIFLLL